MFRQTKRGSGKDMLVALALIALVLTSCALSGCATLVPHAVALEAEHISHPTDGWPFEVKTHDEWYGTVRSESEVNNVNLLGRWRWGRGYLDVGVGANVWGKDGSGFFGSTMTGTVRGGVEWKLKR